MDRVIPMTINQRALALFREGFSIAEIEAIIPDLTADHIIYIFKEEGII